VIEDSIRLRRAGQVVGAVVVAVDVVVPRRKSDQNTANGSAEVAVRGWMHRRTYR
jgi:hypothetical protein